MGWEVLAKYLSSRETNSKQIETWASYQLQVCFYAMAENMFLTGLSLTQLSVL